MQAPSNSWLYVIAVFGPLVCLCGPVRRQGRDDRVSIINPNYTDITSYPYTVSVEWKGQVMGGGVLVAEKWVLTAAFNVDGFIASHIKVRVGSNKLSSGGKLYKVNKMVQHPNYTGTWNYDLSLLRLSAKVSTDYGTPVTVATAAFSGNATAVVTGYGNTSKAITEVESSSKLQIATIQLYDMDTCNEKWYVDSDDTLITGEICGYTAGTGPCYYDYGDPMVVCDDSCTLVGMFAGSYGCADDHFPGVYTDVGYYYDWIDGYAGLSTVSASS